MKQFANYTLLLLFLNCLSSCIGAKKYKILQTQNEKITTTLLETKEELSVAKRNLNKLEDHSSSNQEQLDASIEGLQVHLTEIQAKLQASQAQNKQLQKQSNTQRETLNEQSKLYETQLKPIKIASAALKKEQAKLSNIYQDIAIILSKDPLIQMNSRLETGRLVVTLEQAYFFSSERAVSSAGQQVLKEIAQVTQKYPRVNLDILGHMPESSDIRGTWKSCTRKPLVILYSLLKDGLAPERVRLVTYSQYAPLIHDNSPEAIARNARTELVFHYQPERFIPKLVQP